MKQISGARKAAFYLGTALMIIGVFLIVSFFIKVLGDGFRRPQDPLSMYYQQDAYSKYKANESAMFRLFAGFGIIFIGAIVRVIGARGLAGSGVVLAPHLAREELEPYSRMAGGMIKDALDEARITIGGKQEKVIMIKCRSCGKLNEEDSKYCQECGKSM